MPATSLQFKDLLWPTAPEAFFQDSWEKQPWVVARGEEHPYAGLPSIGDVDKIIAFSRPKFVERSAFHPAPPGRPTFVRGLLDDPSPDSPEDRPGIAELRQVFDQGKSVVIMAMQHRWPAVAELCRNLEVVFHAPVHANLYLTPGGSQGFAPHFDTHEVFVLQLEGIKHWRLYAAAEDAAAEALPLATEQGGLPKPPLGASREVCLRAGDLLYIPRGHVHEAFTSQGASLHLTVGINVYRWANLLQHALGCASRHDLRLRESIPGGALPLDIPALKRHFRQLLELLAHEMSSDALFDQALHSLGDQFFRQLQMLPGDHFVTGAETDLVDLDTVLEKHPRAICRVVCDDEGVAVEFSGNRLGGPHRIASALRFIASATRFAARDLPDDLNDQSKVVLARRLLREGLLTVATQSDAGLVGDAHPTTGLVGDAHPTTGAFFDSHFLEDHHADDTSTRQLAEAMGTARGQGLVRRPSQAAIDRRPAERVAGKRD
ncbi:MAG TPA: cupin domain-containing protein [Pirellulales bacterium]|nr:cupin domain-containing protein [Pirellulales bacterium]